MSYCRWSSEDFSCDVYCYADCSGGYTTHVAGNRAVGEIPKTPPWPPRDADKATVEKWAQESAEAHERQGEFLETCERQPIGLPHDSATFNDPDLSSFLARLEGLKALGYNVPDWVIANVREEMREEQQDG